MGLLHSTANRPLGTLAIAVSVKWWWQQRYGGGGRVGEDQKVGGDGMATMRTGSTCKKFACERKEKSKTHFFAKIKLFITSIKLMFKV